MKKQFTLWVFWCVAVVVMYAQNPIIHNQFTADPTARVFNGKMYIHPMTFQVRLST